MPVRLYALNLYGFIEANLKWIVLKGEEAKRVASGGALYSDEHRAVGLRRH